MLQLVNVMLITPSVCFVMMANVHVCWASLDHAVTDARMAGITLPAVAVSLATVSCWEVNQTFVMNLLVFVPVLMEPWVTCAILALLGPS